MSNIGCVLQGVRRQLRCSISEFSCPTDHRLDRFLFNCTFRFRLFHFYKPFPTRRSLLVMCSAPSWLTLWLKICAMKTLKAEPSQSSSKASISRCARDAHTPYVHFSSHQSPCTIFIMTGCHMDRCHRTAFLGNSTTHNTPLTKDVLEGRDVYTIWKSKGSQYLLYSAIQIWIWAWRAIHRHLSNAHNSMRFGISQLSACDWALDSSIWITSPALVVGS